MKKFKEFLREEDAKGNTPNKGGGDREIPPGYPGSVQQGPPSPGGGPAPIYKPNQPTTLQPILKQRLSIPIPPPVMFDTWEDYYRFLENWFLEQYKRGAFDHLNWSEEQFDKWYRNLLEKHKRLWERQQSQPSPIQPAQPTYA
jgi:hypothetical protein